MTGFQNRMSSAEKRETLLAHELELRGWTVWRWEPIPDEAREHLLSRHMKLPLRWWPDLLAMNGTLVALFDAKGILAPNGAIEADAAWAYESIGELCPVLVFWQTTQGEWVGANANTLHEFTKHDPLKGTRAGSGTPWYKIPADWLLPLDRVLYQLEHGQSHGTIPDTVNPKETTDPKESHAQTQRRRIVHRDSDKHQATLWQPSTSWRQSL